MNGDNLDLTEEELDEIVEPRPDSIICFIDLEADLLDFMDNQNLEHLDDLERIDKALQIYQQIVRLRREAQCAKGAHYNGCYCHQFPTTASTVPEVPEVSDIPAE